MVKCGYCGNEIRWYQRKSFCQRFHWSCGFILQNNGKDLDEYMKDKLTKRSKK